jgi:hypothetical protein
MMGALIHMTAFHSLRSRGMTLNKPCRNGTYKSAKCSAMLSVMAATSIGFAQSGRVSRDSEELRAFMAFNISMTTKMLNETVLADNFGERARTLVEMAQLVKGNLRASGVEHEPPRISKDRGGTNVRANNHVAEEQPTTDERLVTLARRTLHDVVVSWVEGQGGGRETVGDEVDPKKLDRDQGLRHAHGCGEEDGYDFANV